MKHLSAVFGSVLVFFALCCHCAENAAAKNEIPSTVHLFSCDECDIYSIQDQANRMPGSLFKSIAPSDKVELQASYPSSANVFLIRKHKTGQYILIDAGFGNFRSQLFKSLAALGVAPEKISAVFITHIHPDHVGGLLAPGGRVAFPSAKVYIAKKEYLSWRQDPTRTRLVYCLRPYGNSIILLDYDKDSTRLGLIPHCYPGHTPGHTVYTCTVHHHDSENKISTETLWFVGDIVHAADLQIPHPDFCARFDSDPKTAVASRKALLHGADTWFGAHLPFPGKITIVRRKADDGSERFEYHAAE